MSGDSKKKEAKTNLMPVKEAAKLTYHFIAGKTVRTNADTFTKYYNTLKSIINQDKGRNRIRPDMKLAFECGGRRYILHIIPAGYCINISMCRDFKAGISAQVYKRGDVDRDSFVPFGREADVLNSINFKYSELTNFKKAIIAQMVLHGCPVLSLRNRSYIDAEHGKQGVPRTRYARTRTVSVPYQITRAIATKSV